MEKLQKIIGESPNSSFSVFKLTLSPSLISLSLPRMKHDWGLSEKFPFSILWESGVSWSWRKEILGNSPKRWPAGWVLQAELRWLGFSHPSCPERNAVLKDIQKYLLPDVFFFSSRWIVYFGRSYGFFKLIFCQGQVRCLWKVSGSQWCFFFSYFPCISFPQFSEVLLASG